MTDLKQIKTNLNDIKFKKNETIIETDIYNDILYEVIQNLNVTEHADTPEMLQEKLEKQGISLIKLHKQIIETIVDLTNKKNIIEQNITLLNQYKNK